MGERAFRSDGGGAQISGRGRLIAGVAAPTLLFEPIPPSVFFPLSPHPGIGESGHETIFRFTGCGMAKLTPGRFFRGRFAERPVRLAFIGMRGKGEKNTLALVRKREWAALLLRARCNASGRAPASVACPSCGICVERVPWADGKCRQTRSYRWFLARWAKRLSWLEVSRIFHTSWDTVYRSVRHAVAWGLVHRDETGIEAIGVDEIKWKRGHRYVTLVYQIDEGCRRLLWIGKDRTEKTLHGFFDLLGDKLRPTLRYVCSDMWSAYVNTVAERASFTLHVLDQASRNGEHEQGDRRHSITPSSRHCTPWSRSFSGNI